MFVRWDVLCGLVLCAGILMCGPSPEPSEPLGQSSEKLASWSAAASLAKARGDHTATLLDNGRVLVVGGMSGSPPADAYAAELYDPGSNAWTPVGGGNLVAVTTHTATLMADGRVLTIGGYSPITYNNGNAYSRLFDPPTAVWVNGAPLTFGRARHSTVRLLDSSILAAAGKYASTYVVNAERWYPALDAWLPAKTMYVERESVDAVLLTDGRVLFAGGSQNNAIADVELYDPISNSWSLGAPMQYARVGAAVRLPSGKVLVAGGLNAPVAEIFDPTTGGWTQTGPVGISRDFARSVLLGSGKILMCGGATATTAALNNCEEFDPTLDSWSPVDPLAVPRRGHTATLLRNGKVLVVGGWSSNDILNPTATAELYSPKCTADPDCWDGYCVDGFCCDQPCTGVCEACSSAKTGAGNGVCAPIVAGVDPDSECSDVGPTTCGTSGACDGAGACMMYAAGTVCKAATCESGLAHAAYKCDGKGSCIAGALVSCAPYLCSNGDCTPSCQSTGECVTGAYCSAQKCIPTKPSGANCTSAEECSAGFCADGVCCETACDAGPCDGCSIAAGASGNGVCELLTGTSCDDGNACTENDACTAGACQGGSPVVCPKPGPCESVTPCDPAQGCSLSPKANGVPCDDGNACTQSDSCQGGKCLGTPAVTCPSADDCHEAGVCDPDSGQCIIVAKPDGTACDDDDPCTVSDECTSGACVGSKLACDSPGECALSGTCSGNGTCVYPEKPDGTPCSAGTCVGGACTPKNADAGSVGADAAQGTDSGCGCRAVPRRAGDSAWVICVLVAVFRIRRRPFGVRSRIMLGVAGVSALSAACSTPAESESPAASRAEPLTWTSVGTFTFNGRFGAAAAASGDTVVIGAPDSTGAGTSPLAGSVHVFSKASSAWTHVQEIDSPTPKTFERFGSTIALDGDRMLVGPGDLGSGFAHFFVRSSGTWVLEQAVPPVKNTPFATSVALQGDRAVLGAFGDAAAYVLERSSGVWTVTQKLVTTDPNVRFGESVALDGDTIIVGAWLNSSPSFLVPGAAHIFRLVSNTWVLEQKLMSPAAFPGDSFGLAAAVSGDTAIIGAPARNLSLAGAAYVYVRAGTTWTLSQKLIPASSGAADEFGFSIVLGPTRAAIGAPNGGPGGGYFGETTMFEPIAGVWTAAQTLIPKYYNSVSGFGSAVAVSGIVAVVGAPTATRGYIFEFGEGNGESCAASSQCLSGHCVDGVCCMSECGACGACSVAAGSDKDGVCRIAKQGKTCRAAVGPCDQAEVCNGLDVTCPSDKALPAGTVCRAGVADCDAAETCDGTSPTCPADALKAQGSPCRPAVGECDAAETCDGVTAICPPDALRGAGEACRPAAGPCDTAEVCDGIAATCPADGFLPPGLPCRPTAGTCDVAEVCTGWSAACPADAFVASGSVCRPGAGPCDVVEVCSGSSSSCPEDLKASAQTACRVADGACDGPEFCDGVNDACPPDGAEPAGTTCRALAGPCDAAEHCDGKSHDCPPDQLAKAGTVCRPAAGPCDVAELCDGVSAQCAPDAIATAASLCRSSSGECDLPDQCDGAGVDCVDHAAPDGTLCAHGTCSSGVCVGDEVPDSHPPDGGHQSATPTSDAGCGCRVGPRGGHPGAGFLFGVVAVTAALRLGRRKAGRAARASKIPRDPARV